MLAMAYVRTDFSYPGSTLVIDIGGRSVAAKVVPTPFFDPGGARLRAKAKDDGKRAKAGAVPKERKLPKDAPSRPPEEDTMPADPSESEPDANKKGNAEKK